MSLAVGDYVYVHREGLYGRIKDIWEREETFYTVEFPYYLIEDKVFEGRELVKMENPYFPKGGIVTGLKGARTYNFTTDRAIMEVIANGDNGRILVKVLQHSGGFRCVDELHWVDSMWFHHVQSPSNFIR